jgi:nucleoside-diphosphate-sugar epimerase
MADHPIKIAVTGASGFIGRALLRELARRGLPATAVTRDAASLAGFWPDESIVAMDLATAGTEAFGKLGRPDILIHLAWDGLPNYKSLRHFESELPAQFRFLKAMVEAGLPSLLVTGTCFEYGMQSGPLSESDEARPSNPYGHAKDALRQQLRHLQSLKGFRLIWARLFYTYGEEQHQGSLYPLLKAAVLRGDKSFDMSGGEQLRDYLPVEEVARQLARLALSGLDVGAVNICSGKPISVRNLVEGWLRANDWKIALNLGHYPYPDYEPMAFWGLRDKLAALPGPETDVRAGGRAV